MTKQQAKSAMRADLVSYLEGRGFAVYSCEREDDLRTAVILDIETEERDGTHEG